MKRFISFAALGVLLLPIALRPSAAQETRAADADVQTLEVKEEQGGLSIRPAAVYVDFGKETRIRVNTLVPIECSVVNLDEDVRLTADGEQNLDCVRLSGAKNGRSVLKLTSTKSKSQAEIDIRLTSKPPDWKWPWSVAAISLLISGLSFVQLVRVRKNGGDSAEHLEGIQQRIDSLATEAQFATPIPTGNNSPSVPAKIGAGSRTRSTTLTRGEEFMAAAGDWCESAGRWNTAIPQEVRNNLELIRQMGSQADDAASSRFQESAIVVVRVALNHSDSMLDPEFQDARLQESLRRLAGAASLSLLQPRKLDAFNDAVHRTAAREPAVNPQHRGLISGVVRRGLLRNQSTVVSKAEVNVYD